MPSDEKDPLQSLIADILEAENRGESIDRDVIIGKHPDLADSLRDFFANHDHMKSAVESEHPTLTPDVDGLNAPTVPPGRASNEEATIPPQSEVDAEMTPSTKGKDVAGPTVGDQVLYFGDYELLEEIARGGMGIVFRARQINLNRTVALKMILAGQFAGEEDVQRFYTEAEAAARLDHPGIVPIFEIGEHQGQHYFSMGYIEGESLAQKVAVGPLPPREAAELVKKICMAMAYAHERGVIHRDLKPANILIDQDGQPKVTDFGLAKKTEADSNLTGTGQILGTPAYMPPEQASGQADVGPLADVYSLGAILYCLLTGRPPFQAANPMDTLLQVLDKEPIAPRTLNERLPKDLETICLKCLSKEAAKRYPSSTEIARELDRFLNGEPILARPVGRMESGLRWCKRNPAVAALSGIATAFLLAGTVISVYFATQAIQEAEVATQNELNAVVQKQRADDEKEKAEAERERAILARNEAQEQTKRANLQLYYNQINLAQREWETGEAAAAWYHLNACERGSRGWEHRYLYTQFSHGRRILRTDSQNWPVYCVAVSPDGAWIATNSSSRALTIWGVDNGIPSRFRRFVGHTGEIRSVAFNRDGTRVVTGSDDKSLRIWDFPGGKELLTLNGHQAEVTCVEFNRDGTRVLSASKDKTIKVWDAQTGHEIVSLEGHTNTVTSAAFSPDGLKIVSGSWDKTARVWNVSSGKEELNLSKYSDSVTAVAYRPDGVQFVTATNGEIMVCDTISGDVVHTLVGHTDFVKCVAFNVSGSLIVSGSTDNTLRTWDAESGVELQTLRGHTDRVECVAFTADQMRVVSGSYDRTMRIWDTRCNRETAVLKGHTSGVVSVSFSPDGTRIVSGSNDGTFRLWDTECGRGILSRDFGKSRITSVAFSPDGARVVTNHAPVTIKSWDAHTTKALRKIEHPPASQVVRGIAQSPDGTRIVYGTNDGELSILNAQTGEVVSTFDGDAGRAPSLSFSPDGTKVASGSTGGVRLWDVETLQPIREFEGTGGSSIIDLVFSPDGTRLACASAGKTIPVWDTESGEQILDLEGHTDFINCVEFSPDGTRIVSGSSDKTIKLWDTNNGELALTLKGHTSYVHCVAFSPDGSQIVSGAMDPDNTVRIWDARKSEEDFVTNGINSVEFAADGSRIVAGSWDSSLLIWDLRTHDEIIVRSAHRGEAQSVSFDANKFYPNRSWTITHSGQVRCAAQSPDGKRIASGSDDGTLRLWNVIDGAEMLELAASKQVVRSRIVGSTGQSPIGVSCLSFSPDGSRLVTGSVLDKSLKLWESSNGKLISEIPVDGSGAWSVAFSPDGTRIVSGHTEGMLKIWDARSSAEIRTLKGPYGVVTAVTFSSDGKTIASGATDDRLRIWDADTGEELHTLEGHAFGITSVAFNRDGSHIVSGSGDATLKVWSAQSGKLLLTLSGHTQRVNDVAFSPDGMLIVSGSADNTAKIWDAASGDLVSTVNGPSRSVSRLPLTQRDRRNLLADLPKTVVRSWQQVVDQWRHELDDDRPDPVETTQVERHTKPALFAVTHLRGQLDPVHSSIQNPVDSQSVTSPDSQTADRSPQSNATNGTHSAHSSLEDEGLRLIFSDDFSGEKVNSSWRLESAIEGAEISQANGVLTVNIPDPPSDYQDIRLKLRVPDPATDFVASVDFRIPAGNAMPWLLTDDADASGQLYGVYFNRPLNLYRVWRRNDDVAGAIRHVNSGFGDESSQWHTFRLHHDSKAELVRGFVDGRPAAWSTFRSKQAEVGLQIKHSATQGASPSRVEFDNFRLWYPSSDFPGK